MQVPKRVKWRKQQKGKNRGRADRGGTIFFGEYGLQATQCGRITAKQLEASRVAMTRYVKRGGNIWVRIFPHKPITKKAAETRMGSGKGNVEEWAAMIKPGRIIFEMAGIPQNEAFEALKLANAKLPMHCKPISKKSEALAAAAQLAAKEAAKKLKANRQASAAKTAGRK